jgi:probable HAF family extracellular repeat protein
MRTITTIRRLSLALGLYALISSSVAQRLDWLGPIEVRGVTNSGLVIGKAADNSGAVRTVRVHRRLGSELGGTLGGNHSEAWGITGNGLAVVGFSTLSNGAIRAYRQQPLGGAQNLGVLAGNTNDPYYWSEARDVSADGKTVVGRSIDADGRLRAFRWTESGGMQDLGALGGLVSSAFGVSADGAVVVGWASDPYGRTHPFRWTESGGMQDLGTFGGSTGDAWAASADGSVVVGAAHNSLGQWRAFRWSQSTGLQPLGTLGGTESGARDISADGTVIVGLARNPQGQWRAFRWTESTGMQDLTQQYAHLMAPGSYLEVAQSVSPNGRYIVGQGYNAATQRAEAFLLETEPPKPGRIRFIVENSAGAVASSISWDGRVVVGGFNSPSEIPRLLRGYFTYFIRGNAFRWTPTSGLQVIAPLATAMSVSPSGTNIVGICWREGTVSDYTDAFVWTEQGGFRRYPHLISGRIRNDPLVYLVVAQNRYEAATVAADPVPPYHQIPALGVVDGTFEFNNGAGYVYPCSPGPTLLPLYWYDASPRSSYGNPRLLGMGNECGAPFVIPTDGITTGALFVGYSLTGQSYLSEYVLPGIGATYAFSASVEPNWGAIIAGASGNHAVRWVPVGFERQLQPLGSLPSPSGSYAAYGVSRDGRVIVGACGDYSGRNQIFAFRWTESDGMEDLQDTYGHLLTGTNYILREAKAVSYDGRYIVGMASDYVPNFSQALYWLDTWREGDTNGDGCVDDADLLNVLFAFGTQGTGISRHEDINWDGIVDDADLLIVLFNFGQGC